MRIAYFADASCVHGAKWINHFADDPNNTVILFSTPVANAAPRLISDRVTHYPVLPPAFPLRRPLQRHRKVRQIRDLLARHEVDLVHSMYVLPYALWARESGFPDQIVTTRGSDVLMDYPVRLAGARDPWRCLGNWMLRRLFVRAVRGARATTSTSVAQQRSLWEMGVEPSRTFLIRTGVDVAAFDRALDSQRRAVRKPDIPILFSPRVVRPHYNVHVLVQALDRLRRPPHNIAATLRLTSYLASPSYLDSVLAEAARLGVRDRLDVLPPLNEEALARCYLESAVTVMIPRSDGTPVTAIEAMLATTPVVMADLPYDEDLFSDDKTWRTDAGDPGAVAAALAEVLTAAPAVLQAKTSQASAVARCLADLRTELERVTVIYQGGRPRGPVRSCTRCVLDTADDPTMTFDDCGRCSYCADYDRLAATLPRAEARADAFGQAIAAVRAASRGRVHDSIMGLSGGLDSSYACLIATRAGLNPLVVHLDSGWSSELASHNIESIVRTLSLDLHTHVIDWKEFKDLQRAFLRASVVDVEMLTDHAIGAILLREAARRGIRYVISGTNIVTEGILPRHWHHDKADWLNIKAIHRCHGEVALNTYPHTSYLYRQYADRIRGIRTLPILNLVDYSPDQARRELQAAVGWRDYGPEHTESPFSRFYQQYILPRKFGIEKQKAHLATLICSGQITRSAALAELADVPAPGALERDRDYVLKELSLGAEEFDALMRTPPRSHLDYPTYAHREHALERWFEVALRRLTRRARATR